MAAFLNFTKEKEREREENKVVQIPVAEIVPNPHQPRTDFDYNDISSLAREHLSERHTSAAFRQKNRERL